MQRIRLREWPMLAILALPFAGLGAQQISNRSSTVSPAVDSMFARGIATDLALGIASMRDAKARTLFQRSAYETGFELQQTLDNGWIPPGLQAWVVFPRGVDHWHRYTVGQIGGHILRLGGFQSPELLALDRYLGPDTDGLQHRAALLAALADPNGAERFVVSDTVTTPLGSVGSIVSLSTAAFEPNSYAAHWEGFEYAFLFSTAGELVEWFRQESRDVKGPASSTRAP